MTTRLERPAALARDGGPPVRTKPFAPWPVFDEDMQAAVRAVLASGRVNYWTGDECRQFEREFAMFAGCDYAVAVANGTVALDVALHAAGIGSGDEVIVPSRTFIATASSVAMSGAVPVFADIDRTSGNLTAETIGAALSPRTRGVIVVHAAGWPCDMQPILELAERHGLIVIEDCAQSHGARYHGRPTGSLGHIAAFSFCQDKIMTTGGEGGMVTTNDEKLWRRAWSFKDHGKDWDAVYHRQHPTVFRWLHESIGMNGRMTEVQGVIGRQALKQIDGWVLARTRNAAHLNELLSDVPGVEVLSPGPGFEHSYYKHYLNITDDVVASGWTRDDIVRCLNAEGIPCGSGLCCEIYLERAMVDAGFAPDHRFRNATWLSNHGIMFPVHPTLTERDMHDIAEAVRKVMQAVASRSPSLSVREPLRRAA